MSIIGTVESLWRYPVKSMRGESSLRRLSASLASMGIAYSPLEALDDPAASPT